MLHALIILVALHWTCSSISVSLFYWGAQEWTQHSRCVPRGEGSLSLACWWHPSWYSPGCFWSALLWEWFASLVFTRTARSFLSRLVFTQLPLSAHWCMNLFLCSYRALYFLLMNFMRFLTVHFSSPSRSLWTAGQPSGISVISPPVLCHLQTCWGYTLSHHPAHSRC